MEKLILILLCLAFAPLASADELKIKGYIKPDPLRGGNNYLIYNKDGKATGRIAPDPLPSVPMKVRHLPLEKLV